MFNELKVNKAKVASIVEQEIWSLWSTHPTDEKLTARLEEGSMFVRNQQPKRAREIFTEVIKDKKNVLALFTLSFAEDNFLELGDVAKLDRALPRETFAIAMNRAFNLALQQSKQNGIYGYPNPHAVNLEKMAG